MGHDDRREIMERLEALERMVRSRRGDGGPREDRPRGDRDHDRHDHRGRDRDRDRDRDDDFSEKRIIDTIVRLVTEQVSRLVEEQERRSEPQRNGGGERRIVDLIVGLVSEHVQEIVATELDRRLGRPKASPADEEPPPAPGGSSDPD